MEIPLLSDIVIILGLAIPVIFFFRRFRLPALLGFLLTGIVAGPNGLELIQHIHEVEVLAEIGVILLLFVIGIEFSLRQISAMKQYVLLGGALQVGLTVGAVFLGATVVGFSWNEALFLGFLMSLSSTAIVLTLLQEKGAINSIYGKISLAVLIFQDIIVVPMMLFTPLLAGAAENVGYQLLMMLAKAVLVVALVILSARYLVPRLLQEIARTQSRELFLLSVIVICFAVAWGTSSMGLSLGLGAFMAGLVISESEYRTQATALMLPLREIFTSFFFVSIGMLLDLSFFIEHLGMIVLLTSAIILVKGIIASLSAAALRVTLRPVLMTGLSLFQIGEFAFILSTAGLTYNLLSVGAYQYFLAVSILSMAATPFVMGSAGKFVDWLLRTPLSQRLRLFDELTEHPEQEPLEENLRDHVIIIGYGITGRNVARAAFNARIPYVVVDLDPLRVDQARHDGHPAIYGDAAMDFVLQHLHIYTARVAIIAVSDADVAQFIVTQIRNICQTVYLIVRTRMVKDVEDFFRLGANEVVPEEFETSVEVFTRLLNRYFVPQDEIEHFVREIRSDSYEVFRPQQQRHSQDLAALLSIPEMNVTCLRVQHDQNEVVGHTLTDSNVRSRFGINIIGILRNDEFISNISPQTEIRQNDILYLIGPPEAIAEFNSVIQY